MPLVSLPMRLCAPSGLHWGTHQRAPASPWGLSRRKGSHHCTEPQTEGAVCVRCEEPKSPCAAVLPYELHAPKVCLPLH